MLPRRKASSPTSPGSQPQININVSPNISPEFSVAEVSTYSTSPSDGEKRSAVQSVPDIKAVNYKAAFAQGIGTGKSCFIMSFRNDGWADATNVIAHIGYIADSGQRLLVDYGGWIEHQPIMYIPRGHTKNLIIGVTDVGKNFAVTDIGPATNYTQFELVEVGELTPGGWKMVVTLSADKFRRDYIFDLAVGKDGSFLCNPDEGRTRPQQKQKPLTVGESAESNIGSLRPEITTMSHEDESDVWLKGNGEGGFPVALLPFSNDARPPKKTTSVRSIRARLTYYKLEGIEEFKRVDSGCWAGEAYRYADLDVGDIMYLIAAIQINGKSGVVGNPRQSVARYSEDHTVIDYLPAGTYKIKVDLVGGDEGEYAETYWYELSVAEKLKLRRMNQAPTSIL